MPLGAQHGRKTAMEYQRTHGLHVGMQQFRPSPIRQDIALQWIDDARLHEVVKSRRQTSVVTMVRHRHKVL